MLCVIYGPGIYEYNVSKLIPEVRLFRKLERLLEKNKITYYPAKDIDPKLCQIEELRFADNDNNPFRQFQVIYPVGIKGDRCCSYIFNKEDKCVFFSADSPRFSNGGLCNLTLDGYVEKIVQASTKDMCESKSDFLDCGSDETLQIWRILPESSEKLFEVQYQCMIGPKDPLDIMVHTPVTGLPNEIKLYRPGYETIAKFSWSEEKQKFKAKDIKEEYKEFWQITP